MNTKKIHIDNSGAGLDDVLALTEETAILMKLNRKESFYLRLLAEETCGMLRAITGEFSADFWLEVEGRNCKLFLSAKSNLDYAKRKEILSVSTQGKNAAKLGMMEKIRSIFEAGLYSFEESYKIQAEYSPGTAMLTYGALGMMDAGISDAVYLWSMQKYKSAVKTEEQAGNSDASEAWDELEKSIIANIADDVSVAVRRGSVELVITKNF